MGQKITAVQNNGTYEGKFGLMYKQEITLDDGSVGEVSAKTENKWKVGDEVEVKKTETQYGMRFQFSLPETSKGYSGGYQKDPEVQFRIEASWAITEAIQLGAKEHNELVSTALNLIDARNSVIENLKNPK
jgi:hypothetical protein